MRFLIRLFMFALAIAALGSAALWYVSLRGLSARAQPTALEQAVAVRLRRLATPADAKSKVDPGSDSPARVRDGLEHFADYCAVCHGNDGGGDTDIGQGLYPKPPDLRLQRTQDLSDGELFYIIENGVRFTGMPAFGEVHGEQDSWALVRFIRHLPSLTPAELQILKKRNPPKPAERDEEPHRGRM